MEKEKEKEKEKEIKEKASVPSHLLEVWPKYLEMRKKIRKPTTEHAETLLFKKLSEMPPDQSIQIAIVEQSIENSWQGLFPLREPRQQPQQQSIFNQDENPAMRKFK